MRFIFSIGIFLCLALHVSAQLPKARLLPSTTNLGPEKSTQTATQRPANTARQRTTTARSAATVDTRVAPLKMKDPVKINWMSFEEALEKAKTDKRKVLIDVYTGWCGWCKHMDETTFTDPNVVRYINDTYYAVKFDAEDRRDITYKDKVYHFKREGSGGYHELAALLLNNQLKYPHTVFLDENQGIIQAISGYLEANKFLTIINYFGTDNHKKTPWEVYERTFSGQQR
jgi:thioredoxin-related protein